MDILEYIPYGKEKAITGRELAGMLNMSLRDVRRAIADARKETPIINLQDGNGYYRTDEKEELYRYILQENARAMQILKNIQVATKEYNRITGQLTFDELNNTISGKDIEVPS